MANAYSLISSFTKLLPKPANQTGAKNASNTTEGWSVSSYYVLTKLDTTSVAPSGDPHHMTHTDLMGDYGASTASSDAGAVRTNDNASVNKNVGVNNKDSLNNDVSVNNEASVNNNVSVNNDVSVNNYASVNTSSISKSNFIEHIRIKNTSMNNNTNFTNNFNNIVNTTDSDVLYDVDMKTVHTMEPKESDRHKQKPKPGAYSPNLSQPGAYSPNLNFPELNNSLYNPSVLPDYKLLGDYNSSMGNVTLYPDDPTGFNTSNTTLVEEPLGDMLLLGGLSVLLGVMILVTVIGKSCLF